MLKRRAFVFFMVSLLFMQDALGDTRIGDSCDLKDMELSDRSEFLRFDAALKEAVGRGDMGALALLVSFPLRVNEGSGSVLQLANPAALDAHFQTVFSQKIRAAIATQKNERIWCNGDGLMMYGDGVIWVRSIRIGAQHELRVAVVNTAAPASAESATHRVPAFVCSTERLRVIVDEGAGGAARYRVWNKPHMPPDKADLELVGKADFDGHGTCATRIWHFINGNTEYTPSDPPSCGADNETPAASIGIVIAGKQKTNVRCY